MVTVKVGQSDLEQQDKLTLLGSILARDWGACHGIECRIGMAEAIFQRLRPKNPILKTMATPTSTFDCETWTSATKNREKAECGLAKVTKTDFRSYLSRSDHKVVLNRTTTL